MYQDIVRNENKRKMKSAILAGKRRFEFVEETLPEIRYPDDVLIKISYVSICADDIIFYAQEKSGTTGGLVCHEFSGIVEGLGTDAKHMGFSIGDHVSGYPWLFCGKCPYCRSGREHLCINMKNSQSCTREYIVLKDRQIHKLPKGVSLLSGSMTELVATSLHGLDQAGLTFGQNVLILGGGGAGLTLLQLASMRGAFNLTIAEAMPSKRSLALRLGASYVIDPTQENLFMRAMQITHDMGYDLIIDAMGRSQSAIKGSIGMLSRGGTLLVFSFHYMESPVPLDLSELYYKECSICTSFQAPYMLPKACSTLTNLKMESLVGKIFPFSQIQQAFECAEHGSYPRVVFKFGEE